MLSVVAKVNFVTRMGEARISRAWAGAHEQNNWYDSKGVKDREGGVLLAQGRLVRLKNFLKHPICCTFVKVQTGREALQEVRALYT